jgi:hypothetical protein
MKMVGKRFFLKSQAIKPGWPNSFETTRRLLFRIQTTQRDEKLSKVLFENKNLIFNLFSLRKSTKYF